ncbi:hypothetical protein EV175_007426, partial [Coemansia sp. RSA 1933]
MDSLRNFRSTILAGFQDQYVLLRQLAVDIYEALFQHKGCEGALLQFEKTAVSQGIRKYLKAVKQSSIRNGQSKPNPHAKSKGDQASSKQPDPDPLVN